MRAHEEDKILILIEHSGITDDDAEKEHILSFIRNKDKDTEDLRELINKIENNLNFEE